MIESLLTWFAERSKVVRELRQNNERMRIELAQAQAARVDAGIAWEAERKQLNAMVEQSTAHARAATEARLTLQGEIRGLRGQVDELSGRATRAEDRERKIMELMLNVEFQRKFGFAPFPEAMKIPEGKLATSKESSVLESSYVNASDLVKVMCQQAMEEARSPQPEETHASHN